MFKVQDKFDVQILKEVHQLGHYPRRFMQPATDKEKEENCLAQQITKRWSQLDDKTQEELDRLQKDSRDKRTETHVADILDRLRAFGKWPQEHDYAQASNPEIISEAKLAHELRKCCSAGVSLECEFKFNV